MIWQTVIDEEILEELILVYLSNKEPSECPHFKDRVSNTRVMWD